MCAQREQISTYVAVHTLFCMWQTLRECGQADPASRHGVGAQADLCGRGSHPPVWGGEGVGDARGSQFVSELCLPFQGHLLPMYNCLVPVHVWLCV